MRSHSELIQVMLDHINLMVFGLCRYVKFLEFQGYLTVRETHYLECYLENHLPERKYVVLDDGPVYSFPIGDIPSREKWLREQL